MRQFIIALILLVLAVSAFAEAEPYIPVFRLFCNNEYNINMRYYPHLQKVYVNMDFTVDCENLAEADLYSFFLNREANLEFVYLNDVFTPPVLSEGLLPEHFDPVLDKPELLADSSYICYSYVLRDLKKESKPVKFRIRYWIAEPEWQTASDGSSYIEFRPEQYWFVRNLLSESTVNFQLLLTPRYSLYVNSPALFTDKDGIRTFRTSFTDNPNNTTPVRIYKLN